MPQYFITTLILFWIPSAALGLFLKGKLDALTQKSFWLTLVVMGFMTTLMEYVYLLADVWTFSEKTDPLLGLWLWGAPVEEFLFWLGASPFMLLTYLSFVHLFSKKEADATRHYRDSKRRIRENVPV